MIIGQISDGIVLDHITAGKGMEIYRTLHLEDLDCMVAMISRADSSKMGRKDIIKIGKVIDLNFDVLGYIDPGITVNIIKDSKLFKREHLTDPERLVNILFCKNPRCITSIEQELPHISQLSNHTDRVYRCIYCESATKAE